MNETTGLSLIIPTWQAAAGLDAVLDALIPAAENPVMETIVVDGGSTDGTREIAAARGARLIDAARGRGVQLARGADAARGDWLLFLHADTILEPGWAEAVAAFIADPLNQERAAVFRFALDDDSAAARRLERIVAWRCRFLALPYGDQGLLISRAFYVSLGGYRPLPLMEDVDLVRRIGRRRLAMLGIAARSSAARYRRGGYLRRPLRNVACLALYFLGLPPRLIARLYG
ncbi:MAG: TIGR04283 family arsenosugar biosynthesis glycosyltransferase [Alphaproteobacteria bacterium]